MYYVKLLLTLSCYFGVSLLIFNKVYEKSPLVIDELFHLPQGLEYCKHNFTYWNDKITTFPGLYLVSTAFLSPFFKCNVYNLRFVNLIASGINFLLFASILKFVYGTNSHFKTILQAVNLTILPPLYFFSHVYYTDPISLTFLLLFFRLSFTSEYKFLILVFGLFSVLMRQTNVVWVALVFGHKALNIFIRSSRVFGNQKLTNVKLSKSSLIARDVDSSKLKRYYSFQDFMIAVKYHFSTCLLSFFKFLTALDVCILSEYFLILASFAAFVYFNGSIVVGDKKSHEATIHLPQMFYFLIFYGIFGLPYVIMKFKSTFKLILDNKFKFSVLILMFLCTVHYNTIVHPYLLADNRHYTFYVWNRWFGKYYFAKYLTVPLYAILLFSLYDNLREQNCVSFLLPYFVCVTTVLSLQKMIEVRYFLLPFIILRLRFCKATSLVIVFEFVWYLLINMVTLYLFFNKEIMWNDFNYAQRIIW